MKIPNSLDDVRPMQCFICGDAIDANRMYCDVCTDALETSCLADNAWPHKYVDAESLALAVEGD